MSTAAIIGAGFGDEGKGRMTDAFASQSPGNCVVIRYNGGAQAGHTVVCPGLKRHSFSHIGSGSFAGAMTYLSKFFILNPLLWYPEDHTLREMGVMPMVYVNPLAPVSTPYDMYLNREAERARGSKRHGSCGYGVSETVERLCNSSYHLFFKDIGTPYFKTTLKAIRDNYVMKRAEKLGIPHASAKIEHKLLSDEMLNSFIEFAIEMKSRLFPMEVTELKKFTNVIFEGAQGLCLDESHSFFPHVSRSRTGLANVSRICRKAGLKDVEVVYVTRAYMTRHGAGPFPTESSSLSYIDKTNISNEFQGTLRFGCLDVDLLKSNIQNDIRKAKGINLKKSIAVTCLDQVDEQVMIRYKGKKQTMYREALPKFLGEILQCSRVYTSKSAMRT